VRVTKPYLVVRASIEPSVMEEFVAWYESVHLPHVMEIPGIVKAYRSRCHRRSVNWTALYELADDASVHTAITSSQADRARQDWERWLPHVSELSVEVYAGLGVLPTYHHDN
jgi:hypothetical protein